MANEIVEVSKEDLTKLIKSFYNVCGYCDELNIYEWPEADDHMQHMKTWVDEFEEKIDNKQQKRKPFT